MSQAADLLTRLLLDAKQFDDLIKKSKAEVLRFKDTSSKINNVLGGLKGGMLKFAAGIGVATTAYEAFEKTMRSNQTTADFMDNTMYALTNTVDEFFRSIGEGSFQHFTDGLVDSFKKSFQLSAMLDELADKKLAFNLDFAESRVEFEEFNTQARDKSLTKEQRIDALQNMEGVYNYTAKKAKETTDLMDKILTEEYSNKLGIEFDKDDVTYFAKHTNFSGKATANASEVYKTYLDKVRKVEWTELGGITSPIKTGNFTLDFINEAKLLYNTSVKGIHKEALKELIDFVENNKFQIKQGYLAEDSDKHRDKLYNMTLEELRMNLELESMKKRVVRARNGLLEKDGKAEEIIPSKSIAEIDAKIKSLNKQLTLAIDEESRRKIYAEIEKLKQEKIHILIHYKYADTTQKIVDTEGLKTEGKKVTDALNDKLTGLFDNKNTISKDKISLTDQYATALGGVALMLNNVSQAAQNGAAQWLTWGGNLLTAIATALPAITSLIGLKNEEAAANTKVAATGAASSVAGIPIVGPILAVSAIASVLAAIATIPTFANGGIFESNLTTGDKNLARLNGGEMILNRGQQYNLFKLLDNGLPLSSDNNQVKFKIRGEELVGVLNNYNKKTSKIR